MKDKLISFPMIILLLVFKNTNNDRIIRLKINKMGEIGTKYSVHIEDEIIFT